MVEPHLPAEASYRGLGLRRRCPRLAERERPPARGEMFAPPARTGPAWWPWLVWPVVVRTVVLSFACVEAVARHVPLHMPGSTQAGAFISLRADVLWRQPCPTQPRRGSRSRRRLGSISTVRAKALTRANTSFQPTKTRRCTRKAPSMRPSSTGVGCWSPSTSKHGASSGHLNSKPCYRPSLI